MAEEDARAAGGDVALLKLTQWLSPAFPTGAYAYSHGLEWAVAAGEVHDALSLRQWLEAVLLHGTGRSDAILLAHGLKPRGDLEDLSERALALAGGAERERETLEQGMAFARSIGAVQRAVTGAAGAPMPYPLAVAAAARPLGLPARQVVALYVHAFLANLVSAGIRFIPLGQSEGQRILDALAGPVAALAADATEAPLDAIGVAAFRAELAAMHHETISPRIFKT